MTQHSSTPIAVLGAGAWGAALAMVLARNGNDVRLWDIDVNLIHTLQQTRMHPTRLSDEVLLPENIYPVATLEEAVMDVKDICLVVPSFAFKSVLQNLSGIVSKDVRFIWGTKGLNPENGSFMHELIASYFPDASVAALSGPSFAKETALDMPTMVTVASLDALFLKDLQKKFNGHHFKIELSDDIIGVQLCGVVKNVVAIATGIADGMGYGANTRCAIITRGLAEMGKLCEALGGQQATLMSLAGVGDLILTCTDNQSRNRRLGLSIGAGKHAADALKEVGESVEGYYNAEQLVMLAKRNGVSLSVVSGVYQILYEGMTVEALIDAVLS